MVNDVVSQEAEVKKAREQATRRAVRPTATVAIPRENSWTFLTNHAHVLLCLYQQSNPRLRDVAIAVGITERMVQRVVSELAQAGYLKITKEGRCNRYDVNSALYLRHPLEQQHTVGELMKVLSTPTRRRQS